MKKYEVVIHYTSSKIIDSDRGTPEDALEDALCQASVSLCYRCAKVAGSDPGPTGYVVLDTDGNEVLKGDL